MECMDRVQLMAENCMDILPQLERELLYSSRRVDGLFHTGNAEGVCLLIGLGKQH